MKNFLFLTLFSGVILASGFSSNGATKGTSGFIGTGAAKLLSVEEVKNLNDDTPVILEGRILRQIKHEHYEFTDGSRSTIEVEIDDDIWGGIKADENTLLRLYGKVDKELVSTTIDVKTLELVK
ncbi:MAG: YgiW/YdeI family stress tolerance OB fold protein [Wolinella sp.]